MKIEASSPEEYICNVPAERTAAMTRLRQLLLDNLPEGFQETMSYGMIGYVVPKSIYHVDPSLPLPFINLASQKNFMPCIILVFMLIRTCWNGSRTNTPSTLSGN
jgi:hypothetical protein